MELFLSENLCFNARLFFQANFRLLVEPNVEVC
jgi:hypothetical protein